MEPLYSDSFGQGDSNNDIILSSASNETGNGGKRRLLIVILVLLVVAAIGAGVVMSLMGQPNGGGGSGVADTDAANLLDENYDKLAQYQETYVYSKKGYYSAGGFFSESSKEYMTKITSFMNSMNTGLIKINVDNITSDWAKENLVQLKSALSDDLHIYNDTLTLYNLFYDYVNSGYKAEYAESIKALGNDSADLALTNLDATVAKDGSYESGTIVKDLFSCYVPDGWPEEYYYTYAGRVLGGIEDYSEEEDVVENETEENGEGGENE